MTAPDGNADLTGWSAAVEAFTAWAETELQRLDGFNLVLGVEKAGGASQPIKSADGT